METKMTVCSQAEADFFLSKLKPNMRVLEYGSGGSTLEIASRVKSVLSIEHDPHWYNELEPKLPKNVTLLLRQPNLPSPPKADGSFEEFKAYITAPLLTGPYDVIFIDGRARVECAKICKELGNEDTLVFIHDYNRPITQYLRAEYYAAEKYLERISGYHSMWMFKIKGT